MAKKLVGFRGSRLTDVDEFNAPYSIPERWLVEEFNNHSNPTTYLDQVISHPRGYLTASERKVAMTMLQWIGTNVGRGFYQSAMQKADHQIVTINDMKKKLRKTRQKNNL